MLRSDFRTPFHYRNAISVRETAFQFQNLTFSYQNAMFQNEVCISECALIVQNYGGTYGPSYDEAANEEVLRKSKQRQANTELCVAKERSTD